MWLNKDGCVVMQDGYVVIRGWLCGYAGEKVVMQPGMVFRAGPECSRGGAGGYEELSEWHARVQVWYQ